MSLAICLYWPLLLVGLLNFTRRLHRANVCKFLPVGWNWRVHMYETFRERRLWFCSNFFSSIEYLFFALLELLVRLKIGGLSRAQFCFVGGCFQYLFKTVCSILVKFPSSFFAFSFVSVDVIHQYSSTNTAKNWKKFHFILLERSDFHMIDSFSILVNAFARCMFTRLSVDEILLPRYVNWSTHFRALPLTGVTALSTLKYINSVLFEFT